MNNKVVRGSDMAGLMFYLFGPGRRNEHTDPHVVAAADGIDTQARPWALARQVDAPALLFGTPIARGQVWHCSLSAAPGERLEDWQWAEAAHMLVAHLGFDETPERAPCRWVAVHHGLSAGGNDHIHVAVCLVREDGEAADTGNDYRKASAACAAIERRFGLTVVEGRAGRGTPGLTRAEIEAAERRGRPEPDRTALARTVRAAASHARSEGDFAQALRDAGVLVRVREGLGAVVGYAVAVRPVDGRQPVWYGGGRLASDLTLPRLREHWPPLPATAHLAAWHPETADARREEQRRSAEAWRRAADRVALVVRELRDVPVGDTAAWAGAAREAAGVLAAWSVRLEPGRPGPMARASDVLARSALTGPGQPRAVRYRTVRDLRGVAAVAASADLSGRRGQAELLRQMRAMLYAIRDAETAQRRATQAARIEAAVHNDLRRVNAVLRTPATIGAPGTSGPAPRSPRQRPPDRGPAR